MTELIETRTCKAPGCPYDAQTADGYCLPCSRVPHIDDQELDEILGEELAPTPTEGNGVPGSESRAATRRVAQVKREIVNGRRKQAPRGYWTHDRIIEAIVRWAELHDGKPPASSTWFKAPDGYPSTSVVKREFGSWSRAIRAAGLEPHAQGRRPKGALHGRSVGASAQAPACKIDGCDGPPVARSSFYAGLCAQHRDEAKAARAARTPARETRAAASPAATSSGGPSAAPTAQARAGHPTAPPRPRERPPSGGRGRRRGLGDTRGSTRRRLVGARGAATEDRHA